MCAECLVGLPVCSVCVAKWVVCVSEFGCVAGVVSANVLHLFVFCMQWLGVLFVLCLRMGLCVCVMPVAGVALWIPPECGSGNPCVACVLLRSVYMCEGVGTGPERVCPCAVYVRGVPGVCGVCRRGPRGSE